VVQFAVGGWQWAVDFFYKDDALLMAY